MPEPRTVAVFVGTRADLGPLTPVIGVLAQAPDVDLHLLTGVMYDAAELERALPEATSSGTRVHALAEPMGEMSTAAQLEQGALLSAAAGSVLAQIGADAIVVLGDRWELLYVVPPAFLLGVPIVHLHGGEVTEGAVDERIRHAVTKLGDEHCVASSDAAQRLAQMGEPEERIHVTGAPGLDRLAAAEPLDDVALARLLGVERIERPVALFTYHPPTAHAEAPVGDWALAAAEGTLAVCGTVIGTHPGMDEGRDEIIAALSGLAAREPHFRFVDAIGAQYPAVLAAVDVVVGNSSSGVIEAATLHLPAVDVGERQHGRLRGDNVIQAADDRADVERAVRYALSPESLARARAVVNPYGSGDASGRILDIVRSAGGAGRVKSFVDAAANGRPDDSEQDRTAGEEVAP